jgi:hypothetical protein
VAEVARENRFALALGAGAVAVAIGGFWLWRLVVQGDLDRPARAMAALNLVVVVVGAGVLGGAVVNEWGRTGPTLPAAPAVAAPSGPTWPVGPSAAPTTPPPAPTATTTPSPTRPDSGPDPTGSGPGTRILPRTTTRPPGPPPGPPPGGPADIAITWPTFGESLGNGGTAEGTVSGVPAGGEVWLLVKRTDSTDHWPHGPCPVSNGTWACANVRMSGEHPNNQFLLTAVVVPAGHPLSRTTPTSGRPAGTLATDTTTAY